MTLTELFTNIANAIRAKTGSTEPIIAEDFPSAIEAIEVGVSENLDEEIATQEEKIASQDTLIANIAAALEGKAADGGGKTTKTININWDEDREELGQVTYISNNEIVMVDNYSDVNTFIEAENGIVYISDVSGESYHSSNFIELTSNTWVATQDGETIYIVNSGHV
jgi:hypothetical protein